jgi:hypothetical protein
MTLVRLHHLSNYTIRCINHKNLQTNFTGLKYNIIPVHSGNAKIYKYDDFIEYDMMEKVGNYNIAVYNTVTKSGIIHSFTSIKYHSIKVDFIGLPSNGQFTYISYYSTMIYNRHGYLLLPVDITYKIAEITQILESTLCARKK